MRVEDPSRTSPVRPHVTRLYLPFKMRTATSRLHFVVKFSLSEREKFARQHIRFPWFFLSQEHPDSRGSGEHSGRLDAAGTSVPRTLSTARLITSTDRPRYSSA